jgi:long-chain acyl-CoA synthetase
MNKLASNQTHISGQENFPEPDQHATTMPQLLKQRALAHGSRVAMYNKYRGIWQLYTWAEIGATVAGYADGLARAGVAPGDKVAIVGPNGPRLLWAITAVQRLSAIPVVPRRGIRVANLAAVLSSQRVAWVIVGGATETQDLAQAVTSLERRPRIVVAGEVHERIRRQLADALQLDALVEAVGAKAGAQFESSPDEPAVVFYTSGRESEPRPIALTHREIIEAAHDAIVSYGLTLSDREFVLLPFSMPPAFIAGWVASLITGFATGYAESDETALEDLHEFGPSVLFGTPAIYRRLRQTLYARASLQPGWRRRLIELSSGVADPFEVQPARGRIARSLYRVLVLPGIRDALGISRLRVAVNIGRRLPPAIHGFFGQLDLPIQSAYTAAELSYRFTVNQGDKVSQFAAKPPARPREIAFENTSDKSGLPAEFTARPDETEQMNLLRESDWYVAVDGTTIDMDSIESTLEGSLYVRNAFAILNTDGRIAALLSLDHVAIAIWAHLNGIELSSEYPDGNGPARKLISREISIANKTAPALRTSPVVQFEITASAFSDTTGELTIDGKLRRASVLALHADIIERLQHGDGNPVAAIDTSELARVINVKDAIIGVDGVEEARA